MAQKTPCNIIKYDGGDNRTLVYKSEITDFNTESILIVDESQQALLYKDGQAEGPYKSGRYVLPTNNIPTFREKFARLFSRRKDSAVDGSTPFTCDVYFVNTVNDVSVDWGTPSRILVKDPVYSELVNVGANGNVKVKISDPMRFVVSMNGRMGGYSLDRLSATVRGELMTVLKTNIADVIIAERVSLLEIAAKLSELSKSVERKLNERLEDFGVKAVHLNIADVSVDAESQTRLLDRQRKMNTVLDARLQADAEYIIADRRTDADVRRTVRMAEAKAQEREVQGYTYQDEQYWATQQDFAKNPGIMFRPGMMPPMGCPGMPYPAMTYPGPVPGNQYYNPYGAPNAVTACPQCGRPVQPNSAFCGTCGAKIQPPQGNPVQQNAHRYTQSAGSANCPKCGYPLTPRMSVCPNCDYDLENGKDEK